MEVGEVLTNPNFGAALLGAVAGGLFTLLGAVVAHVLERRAAKADERATQERTALLELIDWYDRSQRPNNAALADGRSTTDPGAWLRAYDVWAIAEPGAMGIRVELFARREAARAVRAVRDALGSAASARTSGDLGKAAAFGKFALKFQFSAYLIARAILVGSSDQLTKAFNQFNWDHDDFTKDF